MGKTIIVSSHILHELAELCDSIGIIEKGSLVISGSLDEIKQQAMKSRTLKLKIISDIDRAIEIMTDHPGVGQIHKNKTHLEVPFIGDDNNTADFLSDLISKGVRILSFSESTNDLEEIFLRLTKGEVA